MPVGMLLIFGVPAGVHAQKLTVVAMSHKTDGFDHTTRTPQTSNTNCSVYDTSVNCNTTGYGGGTQTSAVHRLNQVVTSNELGKVIQYTLTRTARWRWSSTDWLSEGESFPAEITGNHMYITCRKGGNQGKKETLKYEIPHIRPVQAILSTASRPQQAASVTPRAEATKSQPGATATAGTQNQASTNAEDEVT